MIRSTRLITGVTVSMLFAVCGSTMAADSVAFITLQGKITEQESPMAMLGLGKNKGETTLRHLFKTIDEIAANSEHKGLVIRLKDAELGLTHVEELGAKLQELRASGKKVQIFSETYGPGEIGLASYADQALIQSGGGVMFPGIYMEEMFLADTLAWAGLKADMVQVGAYKGASEQMANAQPSPEWNENIDQLLTSMYSNMRDKVKKGRSIDDAKLDKIMEDAWMADAEPMVKAGLLDAAVDLPKLSEELAKSYGTEVTLDFNVGETKTAEIDMNNPFMMMQMFSKPPQQDPIRDTIAILHITGTIIDGDSTGGGFGGGAGSVGSRTIRNAIETLKEDDHIKGVIVRIDSPGGSAMASEIMWQGLRSLAAEKPVWSSVGSMAASGGYYVAVGTDKIYVNPSSIVGSIGVVGGKVAMGGLFEKFHVNTVSRARGPRAGMFNSTTVWSDAERELVRKKMTETYTQFTGRVTAGRTGIDLDKTAAGRLFTGNKSIDLKMADKLGGIEVAIKDLAKELKLNSYDVLDYPAPKTLAETIGEALGGFIEAPRVGAQSQMASSAFWQVPAEIVGPHAWPQIKQGIDTMMLLRQEPVLVVTPSIFIFGKH